MSAQSLSERLASHLVSQNHENIPESVRQPAVLHIFDTIGVMLAGSGLEAGKKAYALAASFSAGPAAKFSVTLPGTATRVPLLDGVFAMATAAHCGEMDDIHSGAGTCIGGMVIPAALALAENYPVDGRRFLEAVVAGYETTVRVGLTIDAPRLFARGWWPSTLCGVFGVAAAGAKLFGWPEQKMAVALGIAGLHAGGMLTGGVEGATARHLAFGRAAQSGLFALLAAEREFTGPRAIFEDKRGFCLTLSKNPRWEYLSEEKSRYFLPEVALKPFPCARQLHAGVEALLILIAEQGIEPEQIEEIALGVPAAMRGVVDRPRVQGNREASLASAQYVMAVTALRGRLDLSSFEEECLNAPDVLRLMAKVRVNTVSALDAYFPKHWPARVRIEVAGGGSYAKEVLSPKGESENPMTTDEVRQKFETLATPVIGAKGTRELEREIFRLAEADSLKDLLFALRSTEAPGVRR